MESEDEQTHDDSEYLWRFDSRPYLRLYDEEEMQSRNDASTRPKHKGDEAITEQDVAEEKSSPWSDPRIYIPFRFFASIRGFHTVSVVFYPRNFRRD
jgi:hypothetical protein